MGYKHDYDKTLHRLTTILSRLNDGEALSIKELADEFNVSTRTVQRDLNERLVSYPIYQENKKWKMQSGFKLQKSHSIEEDIVLDILEKMSEGVGSKFYLKAKGLLSKIKNDDFNPIYAKLNMEDISEKIEQIESLEGAIKSKHTITCRYDLKSHAQKIDLKPLKIVCFEGFWYLIALDARNDQLKKYYLKNIHSVSIQDESFETSSDLDRLLEDSISIWFDENSEQFEVKLFVDKQIAKYFKRKPLSPTQSIEELYSEGSMQISIKITHEMEILPLIKYWIPHLRVLEPQWIDERVQKDVKAYLNT